MSRTAFDRLPSRRQSTSVFDGPKDFTARTHLRTVGYDSRFEIVEIIIHKLGFNGRNRKQGRTSTGVARYSANCRCSRRPRGVAFSRLSGSGSRSAFCKVWSPHLDDGFRLMAILGGGREARIFGGDLQAL